MLQGGLFFWFLRRVKLKFNCLKAISLNTWQACRVYNIAKLTRRNKMTDFNSYRFDGFEYRDSSNKYFEFQSQINNDASKALIRISPESVFSYRREDGEIAYVFKIDRKHCLFLKRWQYFDGAYGTYALFSKQYYSPVTAEKPFDDMSSEPGMLTWDDVIEVAKEQQKFDREQDSRILIRK